VWCSLLSFRACLVSVQEAASVTILGCDGSSARDRMISLFGEPEPTLAERLKASVSKTKAALSETVDTIFLGERKIDPSILKDLETALLSADLGVKPTREILDAVREKMDRNALADAAQLKREIKSHIIRILNAPVRPDMAAGSGISTSQNGSGTRGIFIVGVNRAGQNHQHWEAGQPASPRRPQRGALRRGHVSRRRSRATGNLGATERNRGHQTEIRRRSRCGRLRCSRRRQSPLRRCRHRGYRGTPAHQIESDG